MAPARSTPLFGRSLREWLFLLPAAGIVAVPAIVVPAILWARISFHLAHPSADPNSYLTISRAISDPAIGAPFAFWVTIAAVILWISVQAILWMLVGQHPRRGILPSGRDRWARALFPVMWATMTATCVGMVMLSHYRLGEGPSGHRLHMIGSYVFFGGQATTILLSGIYHALVAPGRSNTGAFFPDRWRARAGVAVFLAAALYGVFFRVKSMDLGAATPWVISAYVELETILIIVFLGYLAGFLVDVARFLGARARGRSVVAVAEPAGETPVGALADPVS